LPAGGSAEAAHAAQSPVKYIDEDGTTHQANVYTVLNGSETEIGGAEEMKGKKSFKKFFRIKVFISSPP